MVKEKIKRFVMVGERNSSRIKKMSKQIDVNEFVDNLISCTGGIKSVPRVNFTIFDVMFQKQKVLDKINEYVNTKISNAEIRIKKSISDFTKYEINRMIEEDD